MLTSMRLCSNALAQLVIPAALEDMQTPLAMVSPGGRLYEQRKATLEVLKDIDGISFVKNAAAFYLFPRALEPDARAFCLRARKYDLILVPGDSFGCPGHVRISYCVPTEQIQRALPKFKKLAEEYGL